PGTVESQPELLARHCTEAGLGARAVRYWQRAGKRATQRSAHVEAIAHLKKGLETLKTLPETPEHTRQALALYTALGAALVMAKGLGAPEVEHAYTQAHALCQQVGETPELVPVLYGLRRFYVGWLQLHKAREIDETLLRLARRPRARGHRPLCPRDDVALLWRVAGRPPAPGGSHRTRHARPAPCTGVPHRPVSGCGLPSRVRPPPLVTWVSGSRLGPPPRGPGVGARAAASL